MKPYLVKDLKDGKYDILIEQPVGGSRPRMVLKQRVGGQRFLFKTYVHNAREVWAELFASKLGELLGLEVQKVTVRKIHGRIKSNFEKVNENLPDDWQPIGAMVRHAFPRNYDIRYGKNIVGEDSEYLKLDDIEAKVRAKYYAPEDIMQRFAEMVIFDAFIGNMDRHHENWGIVEHSLIRSGQTSIDPKLLKDKIDFATLFDHGSSLLFELDENGVAKYLADLKLFEQKYILGKKYSFFVNRNGDSENIFSMIKWYIDNDPPWKKRFISAIKKMFSGVTVYDLSTVLVKMPQHADLAYSEERRKLLLESLLLRKSVLTSYL